MIKKGLKIKTILLSILALTFLVLGIFVVLIYGFNLSNSWTSKVGEIIPFPAAVIERKKIVSISDLRDNSQSVKQFYENQDFSQMGWRVDFNTPDGQKRLKMREKEVFLKMIEDYAILILARKEEINITQKDLNENVDKKLEEYGNRDTVEGELRRLYGWTIEDFKQKIVSPSLYREKLENIFQKKYQNFEESKKRINEAAGLIAKKEKTFSELASQFSEGSTADAGGELGWFKKGQIAPEIADKIFSLKNGEISPVLESQLGFHIVEMEEKKKENEEELVRIRQIFSAKKTFSDWIDEQMKTMKIWIPMKDYTWNAEKLRVDFTNQEMKNFEEDSLKDPKGDISVIF